MAVEAAPHRPARVTTRRDRRSRAVGGKGSRRSAVCHPSRPACASASSTTACSRGPSAAPSAGTATSASGSPRGPRGHVPHAPPVGSRGRRVVLRRAGRGGRPAHGALHRRAAADPPAARVRRRRALAPAAPRARATTSCTPHRSRTSRCSPPALARRARRLRPRRRLARGLEPRATGASTSGAPAGASARRCSGSCIRLPQRAFCFSRLHRDRLRAAGLRGRADRARGRVRGRPRAPPQPGRPSRSWCSPGATSPRSARPPCPGGGRCARERLPELRGEVFGDGPSRPDVLAAIADAGMEGVVEAPGLRRGRAGRRRAAARAVHGPAVDAGRATGWSWSRRRRAARRAWWSRAPTTRRPSSSTTARTASSPRRPRRGPGGGDRPRPRGRGRAARAHAELVRAQRPPAVAGELARRSSSAATPSAARARSSRPSARRCAPT